MLLLPPVTMLLLATVLLAPVTMLSYLPPPPLPSSKAGLCRLSIASFCIASGPRMNSIYGGHCASLQTIATHFSCCSFLKEQISHQPTGRRTETMLRRMVWKSTNMCSTLVAWGLWVVFRRWAGRGLWLFVTSLLDTWVALPRMRVIYWQVTAVHAGLRK